MERKYSIHRVNNRIFQYSVDQIIVLNSLYAFSNKILILQFCRKQNISGADKEARSEHSD